MCKIDEEMKPIRWINEFPILDALVTPCYVPNPDVQGVYISLIDRIISLGIDLKRLDIALLSIPVATINALKRANIGTLGQLAEYSKADVLNVPSIGIIGLEKIDKELNSFLIGLLPDAERKLVRQHQPRSNEQLQLVEHDLIQHLCEYLEEIGDIFKGKVPVEFMRLIPQFWGDLITILGKEPESFDELVQLAAWNFRTSASNGTVDEKMEHNLALKRITQWLEEAMKYGCLDEEMEFVTSSLTERERLIITERYNVDKSLTLEAIGKQLGLSRERVRQIEVKAQKKLVANVNQSTLLYSRAAVYILGVKGEDTSLPNRINHLTSAGFLKEINSLNLLLTVAKSTESRLNYPLKAESIERVNSLMGNSQTVYQTTGRASMKETRLHGKRKLRRGPGGYRIYWPKSPPD